MGLFVKRQPAGVLQHAVGRQLSENERVPVAGQAQHAMNAPLPIRQFASRPQAQGQLQDDLQADPPHHG